MPVYVTIRDEMIETIGQTGVRPFVAHVAARGSERYLPHPALRRHERANRRDDE